MLSTQYDVIKGSLPKAYNEIVLVVDENNEISDYTLYALGVLDSSALKAMFEAAMKGEEIPKQTAATYTYDDILDLRYKLLVNTEYYQKNEQGLWVDRSADPVYLQEKLENATELKVVGILRPKEGASISASFGTIGYRSDLMTHLINEINDSTIVKEQQANPTINILTGMPFPPTFATVAEIEAYATSLPPENGAALTGQVQGLKQYGYTDERIVATINQGFAEDPQTPSYDKNLKAFGVADLDDPSGINLYPKDFAAKDEIAALITAYNNKVDEADAINYTDYIGLMMSSVTTIINSITIILIAFVAISLVVSSIMIGIITYISVLERTKEIGILRAMGASKRDVSRVFNAETMIVGFTAGALGILVTLGLNMIVNAIVYPLTDIPRVAVLPVGGAVILVAISVMLTLIAGLIPSRVAAHKDPVVALRTE